MSEITLKARRREPGRSAARAMRRESIVPGVYYFHGEESVSIAAHELALRPLIYTSETHLIRLELEDGEEKRCILKAVDFDPITDRPTHFDLMGVAAGERMRTEVPVSLTGTSIGVKDGGVQQFVIHRLDIECLPKDLPEHVEIDVTNLKVGDSVHVADLDLGDVTILNVPEQTIVTIVPPRVLTEEEGGAAVSEIGGTEEEPEVIGKGGDEDERDPSE